MKNCDGPLDGGPAPLGRCTNWPGQDPATLAREVAELQNTSDCLHKPYFLLGWFSVGTLPNDLRRGGEGVEPLGAYP